MGTKRSRDVPYGDVSYREITYKNVMYADGSYVLKAGIGFKFEIIFLTIETGFWKKEKTEKTVQ